MARKVQLLLPLEIIEEPIPLSQEDEKQKEIVTSMAILLLQMLCVDDGKEGEDDLGR